MVLQLLLTVVMLASIISNDNISILNSSAVSSNLCDYRGSIEFPEFYSTPHFCITLHVFSTNTSISWWGQWRTDTSVIGFWNRWTFFHALRAMLDDIEPEILFLWRWRKKRHTLLPWDDIPGTHLHRLSWLGSWKWSTKPYCYIIYIKCRSLQIYFITYYTEVCVKRPCLLDICE